MKNGNDAFAGLASWRERNDMFSLSRRARQEKELIMKENKKMKYGITGIVNRHE